MFLFFTFMLSVHYIQYYKSLLIQVVTTEIMTFMTNVIKLYD